jgi:glyoxylase I family protein
VEKVTGIGGVFFRARDPKAFADWYRAHLGVDVVPDNYDDPPWQQQAGPTAYAPFPEDIKYFGNPSKQWMINFRVSNLDAMVAQLKSAGISVDVDPERYPNGCFARLLDLEGNPVELWQPMGRDEAAPFS